MGEPVVVRELMPQDLKLKIDQSSRREAVASARYLAEVVGKALCRARGRRIASLFMTPEVG